MKFFLSATIFAMTCSPVSYAEAAVPRHILSDTICVGPSCPAVELYASLVAPALGESASAGRLLVDGVSPFAACLERLDRDKVPAVASCIERRLPSLAAGAALAAGGHDLYMVLVVASDRDQAVQGDAIFLTPAGRTFTTPVILSPLEVLPDGTHQHTTIKRAVSGSPILLDIYQLPERAGLAGIAGFPPHRPIVEWIGSQGRGTFYGTAVVKLPSADGSGN